MFDAIIRFSIRNKLLIGAMMLALLGWGGFAAYNLPVDAVPDITNNQVVVITQTPALAAQETERFITAPLELAMANLQDVVEIRSVSRLGLSVLTIVFSEDTDILKARQLVSEQLTTARQNIPAEFGQPFLAPITTGLGEIYQYTLVPKPGYESRYSLSELRTIQDWIVKRQLAGIPGVIEISSFGGYVKQYEISADPDRLRAVGVSLTELTEAVSRNNANTGGSYIEKTGQAYFIRGEGATRDLREIGDILVRNHNGVPLRVSDIAEVRYGHAVRFGALTRNGSREVVGGIVLMLKGADSETTIKGVQERIGRIQKTLPEGLSVEPFIDRTKLISKTIRTVVTNLIEGGLIVVAVLIVLMGSWRAGLVVASVIPLAMLFTLGMMYTLGISANLMSLGAIDFGLIVDGSIIVVEAVLHTLFGAAHLRGRTLSQTEMDETVFQSASSIRQSAAFGEIIILIVYLPILALTGIEGKMFRPMAMTVSFAILAALILSLTYVPMIATLVLSKKIDSKKTLADRFMEWLYRHYEPLLRRALRWRKTTAGLAVALFGGTLILFGQLGGEFVPTLDEGDMAIDFRTASGTSLNATVEATLKAEQALMRHFPEINQIVGRVGASEIPTDPMPVEMADLMINMKDRSEWKAAKNREEMAEKMSEVLSREVPGTSAEFTQPIQMRFNEMMTGVRSDVVVKIFGEDLDTLFHRANACARLIEKIDGVASCKVEQVVGLPQINVQYDRAKLAQYNISIADANQLLRTAFAGEMTGVVFEGEKRFDVVVRLDSAYRKDIQNVRNLVLPLPGGGSLPLEEVAAISYQLAPAQISRDGTKRRITIGVNIRGRDVESVVADVQKRIESRVSLPAGYYFTYGGAFENLQEAKQRLIIAVPIALFLIFMLLFITFRSLREALLIFSSIPLAAVGGILALWLRGMPFSISAGVGFIALFGVAVLNGIVLISYLNHLEKEGDHNLYERILHGVQVRFRPVILTAAVASLGFLPMALSGTAGAEVQKPLATVVIGGLITATLLTLVVLPVLYSLFGRKKPKAQGPALATVVLLSVSLSAVAQQPAASVGQTPSVLSLREALETGLKQNPQILTRQLEVQGQRALLPTAFDPPRAVVDGQFGQTQASTFDYTVSGFQTFAMPGVYRAQRQVLQTAVTTAEQRTVIQRASLAADIKRTYYQLLHDFQLLRLIQQQDSLYRQASRAAAIRLRTGETNRLEAVSATSRQQGSQLRLVTLRAAIQSNQQALQLLLNSTTPVLADTLTPLRRDPPVDSGGVDGNPVVGLFEQQLVLSRQQTALERLRLRPDFQVGYLNQSILRTAGYQAFLVGMAIPLFAKAQKARITASRISEQISETQLDYTRTQLRGQIEQLLRASQAAQTSLQFFEQSALPQAQLILTTALRSYQNGEIDYVELFQNTQQAYQIREQYLTALLSYSLLTIRVEELIGIQQ
ncbi:CusA/CzcA family heavy metal efflux RND transporter [Tellurirhabdus rosea]|uniref:CusA/CzcA family heavy metal efflux RND transporter n=1 Tax=Tellurirhabdus rosea TaxID=2674997 RepID=UPI002255C1AF|nr:CusA/CzcA family heavy metal efflux RND transporter [Tellurirhabdus rosea]